MKVGMKWKDIYKKWYSKAMKYYIKWNVELLLAKIT